MQVGEGQGQRHHHEAGERVEGLAPELDVVGLGGLLLRRQVFGIAVQLQRRHRHGWQHGRGDDAGVQRALPVQPVELLLADDHLADRAAARHGAGVPESAPDRLQMPQALCIDVHLAGLGARHQPALGVELVDAHVLQGALAADAADLDGVAALLAVNALVVLEPGAALGRVGVAHEAGPQLVAAALELWRDIVADDEGQHGEHRRQPRQQAQRAGGPEAAGAQDGELAALRQPGERHDGADQHRDREQLVEVAGQLHRGQQRGFAGAHADAGHALQLVDEVDEEEQRQEGHGHQHDRADDVLVEQAADGLHAGAPVSRRRRQKRLPLSRSQIIASDSSNALPCTLISARGRLMRPLPTQDCDRLMRLK